MNIIREFSINLMFSHGLLYLRVDQVQVPLFLIFEFVGYMLLLSVHVRWIFGFCFNFVFVLDIRTLRV